MNEPNLPPPSRTAILPPPLRPGTTIQYALFYCLDMPPKLFTPKARSTRTHRPSPLAPPEEPANDKP